MHITKTLRVRLFVFGGFWFIITEAMRSLYRPWVYSHGYADFHLADTIGSSGGAIAAVLIIPALFCRKRKGPMVLHAAIGVWIGQVLYEFIQPWVKTGLFDWYDVIAATVGGCIGVVIVNWNVRRFLKTEANKSVQTTSMTRPPSTPAPLSDLWRSPQTAPIMNSTSQAEPEKRRAQWLLGIIGLLIIPGMFWLAAYFTSYPEKAMVLAKKYGGFIWIALALAWLTRCLVRRKTIQK